MSIIFSRGIILILTLFVLAAPSAFAQKDFTEEADQIYNAGVYGSAIEAYKKAYSKETNNKEKARILYRIGDSYRLMADPAQAEIWYRKAEAGDYTEPELYLNLGDVMREMGRYEDAVAEYKKAVANGSGTIKSLAEQGIAATEKAVQWQKNPLRYVVRNESQLNSKEYDFSPVYADKKYESLIFTSSRMGAAGNEVDGIYGQSFEDLYYTTRDNKGKWSTPQPLGETINSSNHEGSAAFDSKFGELYFTRCDYAKKKARGCEIYKARSQGQGFAEAELLDFGIDDTTAVGHPVVIDDELLIFASDLAGGQGGKDLWYIRYDDKARIWGPPTNLGPSINTPGNEMFPYIRHNGDLYFASDGHPGMGGLDIFKAKKLDELKWGNVENMKAPFNSPANDYGIVYEGEEDRGFLTSNREGTKGGDDIWSFMLPPLIFMLEGTVTDVDTKEPLQNAVVKLLGTDGSVAETTTDPTGHYRFEEKENGDRYIVENTSYTIEVSGKDLPNGHSYLNSKGQETTVGLEQSTAFVHDFALQCADCGEIRFPLVQYDLGSWELQVNDSVNSKDSLEFLYTTLVDNPTIIIELSAHTDARGSDKSNEILSQKRAETCVNYLIERGIPAERMVPKGYGEKVPYTDFKTEPPTVYTEEFINALPTKEEREAAHQRNRRTVFSVLSDDYVPAEGEGTSPDGAETGATQEN